ncbi:RNB domain-containing ribonuclease [Actinomyces gaoshouyii]|uniref:RNB domain-containing ribonuclease n=1 Tax=Actinomyces gaoshouyii TaxID=1960083 RepID=UPI0009C066A6|nr:RNB domain-containing ribonuclease [Actinomyces gaoshouyii]ARD42345.1 DNA-binding protein [Actinomyces gaoshouyii]
MSRARLSSFTAPPGPVVAALAALRERYEIPDSGAEGFPADALAEAEAAAAAWRAGGPARLLAAGARDARDLPLVTIDPPGSMDLDQAVALERLDADALPGPAAASGGAPGPRGAASDPGAGRAAYRISYAIASLATFVTPGGSLDAELARRGETVYLPDASTPLHPPVLAHGAASLLPDQERPACLWTIDLDAAGAIVAAHVERALVRSRARLTYQEVQAALDTGTPLPGAVPAELPALLATIGTLRQQREAARGGVSLPAPEHEIERDGEAYRLVFRVPVAVEGFNAQISLLTGICAARIMADAGVGVLRTMPPAAEEDRRRLRRVARALRIDWPATVPYAELVRGLDASDPAHLAFMDHALTLFRGSGYLTLLPGGEPLADGEAQHAAIASRYAHVTAPLRRLVDRYGLEACLAACDGRGAPDWVVEALPGLPETMATTGRRASAASRGAIDAIEALVLAGHEGEVFDAVITSERDGRGEVMLDDPAVRGTVVGRSLPVGQDVRVRLESVDVAAGRTRFRLEADR